MTAQATAQRPAVAWPLLVGVAALAGCTAAGIGVLSLAAALTATGLPNPGPVTTIGLPFVRAAGEVAAVVAVGSFLTAAFLVPVSYTHLYHEALGVPISALPMAVPVSLRAESDAAGGNRFTGVNLAAPIGTTDPVARMRKIRSQMTQRRDEPAMDIIGSIAPVLSVLPGPLLESITGSVVGSDVQASNVAVYPGDTFLVGAKILRQYGIGPLPGVAMMVVLISRGGNCTITARYDRAAIRDEKLFARCLLDGFNEILALAGDPAPQAVPASFDVDASDAPKRSAAGS